MQVWELIALLSKCPAGADVKVSLTATMYSEIQDVSLDEGEGVCIDGGDALVIDAKGDSMGMLSQLADAESE